MQFGHAFGMPPAEYYLELIDFRNRTEGRELIYVDVGINSQNVI